MDTNSLALWRKLTATITEPKRRKCYALQKFAPYFICRMFCSFIISAYIFIDLSHVSWKSLPPFTSYKLQYNTIHKRSPSPYIPATNYNTMHKQVTSPPPIYPLRIAIQCKRLLKHNALVRSNWATCWDNRFPAGVKDFSVIDSFPISSAAYQTPIQWIIDCTIARK